MSEEESKIILYTTDDGKSQVSLMSRDGRVWLNQKQMAELFAVSKPNISMLIAKIFAEKEVQCHLLCVGNDSCCRVPSSRRSRDAIPAMGQCAFERVSCKGFYD